MADETKRVIDQTTDSSLSAGDYVIVDSQSEGTRKFDLGTELTDIKQDLAELEGGGLTDEAKQALLACFRHIAFLDDDDDYYQDLYDALYNIVVTNISLNTNTLSFGTLNATQQLTATTTPTGGSVTWSSSNTSVATVSSSGLVTSVGYGNATITATSGNVSASCSVTVAQATLTSISAIYTQSGTVYDTDTLDSLKTDLVVTATWSDSSTSTVASNDYTLSGTLTVGSSTITVSYGGKTATFIVTVSQGLTYLYNWNFADSLTDTVQGVTATTTATQTTDGLSFANNQYVELIPETVSMYDKTVIIKVVNSPESVSTQYHHRLFGICANHYNANNSAATFLYRYNSTPGWTTYLGSSWDANHLDSSTYPISYFTGKKIKLYFDTDGKMTVSCADINSETYTTLMTSASAIPSARMTGYLTLGSSSTNATNGFVISGVGILEGEV